MKLIQTQEQKLQQVQRLSQQQMLQVHMLEMPLTELEENVNAELDDNPALVKADEEIFDNWNIHIHVPEGATPKDGPSAGITIATSIASALTQRKVRKNTAMTGEITLRGKVLPVGGIKEKILAAKRAGVTEIVISEDNRKDVEDIKPIYVEGLSFHYVKNIDDVISYIFKD